MSFLNTDSPRWWAPGTPTPPVHVYNSLVRRKVELKPIKEGHISWYACGPTVYDDAHLGHARNYVTADVLRRILKDYFLFRVNYVMNITDVDDKIILRGRQQHLLASYRNQSSTSIDKVKRFTHDALNEYIVKKLPLIKSTTSVENVKQLVDEHYGWLQTGQGKPGGLQLTGDDEAKLKMHVQTVLKASDVLLSVSSEWDEAMFYEGVEDVLLPYLDAQEGSKIDASDHSIFTKLTTKYEERFMEDMRNLNVLDPDALTRVTEYGQQIIGFVQQIEKNGYAYTTNDGSVYFDIAAFEHSGNQYAKLRPENRGNKALQSDGEGALSMSTSGKRSDADFALWKASKPGEPAWDSPWGKGRPGWHIECSAMAYDKLGQQMDIHSGGIDLAFPHHDNELAQSEAFLRDAEHDCEHSWVNNFLHMGHLSIQGAKMSKSLKNFTTIRQALIQKQWTSRSLRIVFLLGAWKDGIEITDDMVQSGISWEERVNNFFLNSIDLAHSKDAPSDDSADSQVLDALQQAVEKTQIALADSFDTPRVMVEISNLITVYNSADRSRLTPKTAVDVARWVTAIVNIFGLNGDATTTISELGWSGVTIAKNAQEFVYPLSRFRDSLRRKARQTSTLTLEDIETPALLKDRLHDGSQQNEYAQLTSQFINDISKVARDDDKALKSQILKLCDELRDTHLWAQNIYLEDRDKDHLPALVRPVTAQMREEKERQGAEKVRKEQEKLAREQKRKADEAAKLEQGKVSPRELFKTAEYTAKYSAWDDDGLPTKNNKGEEVSKAEYKRVKKIWEKQHKLHEAWQRAQS